jgi:hypothetical protein
MSIRDQFLGTARFNHHQILLITMMLFMNTLDYEKSLMMLVTELPPLLSKLKGLKNRFLEDLLN